MSAPAAQMISLASACAALFAAAVSLIAAGRCRALARGPRAGPGGGNSGADAAIGVLQEGLEEAQRQIEEIRRHASSGPPAKPPRAGLNLEKRSQALRMHRRGEAPSQIATALELPLQEVNLLLKVHRIVMRSI